MTLNETDCDWLFDMSVKQPHGRALANESCHVFQTFSRQSVWLRETNNGLNRPIVSILFTLREHEMNIEMQLGLTKL